MFFISSSIQLCEICNLNTESIAFLKITSKVHKAGYRASDIIILFLYRSITSSIVSAIVIYAGVTALVESIKKIFNPEVPDYSITTLVIIIVGIIIKFILGLYVKRKGKQVNSDSLVASGSDAFNDAILSML